MQRSRRWLVLTERACWMLGLVGLAGWSVFQALVAADTRDDLARFAAVRARDTPAVHELAAAPLAVLRIPKIRLEVPVLSGTGTSTLARGVGLIDGTAPPGTDGNAAIAGHRDTFFRGLKDMTPGDAIELETLQGLDVYRVERTWVVNPEDLSVLAPTADSTLTLVTCYPFHYVGPAPKRFIVRAVRAGNASTPPPHSIERQSGSEPAGRAAGRRVSWFAQ